jgi:3'-5' exoribonuclease-like protein
MKYVIDTEFIDTPECSALISLGIVNEHGESRYFEFAYPKDSITPWLAANVLPHLTGKQVTFAEAANDLLAFVGGESPEFWCYYGAYDWYWFCRVFGGFMQMPKGWPIRFHEFAAIQAHGVTDGPAEHNALSDAQMVLKAVKAHGICA